MSCFPLPAVIGLLTVAIPLTVVAQTGTDSTCRDAIAEARYTQLQPGVFMQLPEQYGRTRSTIVAPGATHREAGGTAAPAPVFVDVRTRPDAIATLVACTDCQGVRAGSRVTLCARNRGAGDVPALQPLTPVLEARRTTNTDLAQGQPDTQP